MTLCIDGDSYHYVPTGQSCNGVAHEDNPVAPISASTILPIFAGWSPVTEFPDDTGQGFSISAVHVLATAAAIFLIWKLR